MSTIEIDLKDIFSQAVSCEVIFRPKETPFINGTQLTITAHRSVRTDSLGTANVQLEPGEYEVFFSGIEHSGNRFTIGVPDDDATYPFTALINEGTVIPNPPQLQGLPGSQIYSDARDPVSGDAVNGDYWFNTDTKTLFGPKAAGSWPAGVSLRGAAGATGATGATGPQGPKGNDGADGANGADGQNGVDGINGADGLDGADGREVEFQVTATQIQWRYEGELSWNDLIAVDDLKGPPGEQGPTGPLNEFAHGELTGTSIDCSQDKMFYRTISSNTTFTFSGMTDGRTIIVDLTTVGSVQPTWPTGVKWPYGITPTHPSGTMASYSFSQSNGIIKGAFLSYPS